MKLELENDQLVELVGNGFWRDAPKLVPRPQRGDPARRLLWWAERPGPLGWRELLGTSVPKDRIVHQGRVEKRSALLWWLYTDLVELYEGRHDSTGARVAIALGLPVRPDDELADRFFAMAEEQLAAF